MSEQDEIARLTRERDALRAALVTAERCMARVPIVHRPDAMKGPPFSVCLGCKSEDGEDCKPACWAMALESAIDDARGAIGEPQEGDLPCPR